MIAVNRNRPQTRHFVLTKVGECLYRSECGSYFAVVKHLGKQHRKSLQTKHRNIAAKKLGEFRQKLRHLAPAAVSVRYATAQDEAGGTLKVECCRALSGFDSLSVMYDYKEIEKLLLARRAVHRIEMDKIDTVLMSLGGSKPGKKKYKISRKGRLAIAKAKKAWWAKKKAGK